MNAVEFEDTGNVPIYYGHISNIHWQTANTLSGCLLVVLTNDLNASECQKVACMYVCMYVRTYVCMYVCMYVWHFMYIYIYSVYIYIYTYYYYHYYYTVYNIAGSK